LNATASFVLSPVPLSDNKMFIELTLPTDQTVSLVLQDISGRQIAVLYDGKIAAGGQKLPLQLPESLARGTYMLKVTSTSLNSLKKVIVQ
jgi:hypothetical protein